MLFSRMTVAVFTARADWLCASVVGADSPLCPYFEHIQLGRVKT